MQNKHFTTWGLRSELISTKAELRQLRRDCRSSIEKMATILEQKEEEIKQLRAQKEAELDQLWTEKQSELDQLRAEKDAKIGELLHEAAFAKRYHAAEKEGCREEVVRTNDGTVAADILEKAFPNITVYMDDRGMIYNVDGDTLVGMEESDGSILAV